MAEVNATFNYDADFSSAISEVRKLSQELSVLNTSFNSLDKNARQLRNDIASTFSAGVGDLGAFSTKVVDISSSMDHFGKSLDQGKLKLRDYYREASRAFQANSNAHKLAVDQIRRTRSELVQLGIDPSGRSKGILVTPLKLDMSDMTNQLAVARKQFDIFNALVQGGATKLINFGKNTQWAGRQLTVGITVPMSIFASTVTKAFMDVDAELTRFQKVYGSGLVASTSQSTAAIRGQVQGLATDIAKQYGVAAKETAGLAADLAATGLEGQSLLTSIKQTTRLAVLGEVDRQTAMKATLAIQNAFKTNTKDLADSINFLNAVENQTSTSLVDLTEAIPKAGPVIKALGGDVKDLSLLLVAMKEGGIGVAEGANSIKSGLASLINPTKAAIEVGKQYGINIEEIVQANKGKLMPTILAFQNSLNTLDDFSKAQVIEKIFGKYQFARMSALFDNLNASGSQTKKVLELMSASNSQLAAIANQEIKTLTESASMRFKRSMEAIRASLLPVGQTILTSVLPYLEKFSSFIDKVVEVGKNLPEPIKQFIKFGSAITAIAGPLVMIGGVLANFLGYVTKGAMGFVNLGRRMAGLPTHQFELLTDEQLASAKATDILTVSIERQKSALVGLNALMKDYVATLVAQREATPGAFSSVVTTTGKKVKPIKKQSGGSAWVPGSGSGDKIPALLEPGEFVVNRNAARQNGGLLTALNSNTPRFQKGGVFSHFASGENNRYLDIGFDLPSDINRDLNFGEVRSSTILEHISKPGSENTMISRLVKNGISEVEARKIAISVKNKLLAELPKREFTTDLLNYADIDSLEYEPGKRVGDLHRRVGYNKEVFLGLSSDILSSKGLQSKQINFENLPDSVKAKLENVKGFDKMRGLSIWQHPNDPSLKFYGAFRVDSSGNPKAIFYDDTAKRQLRPQGDRKRESALNSLSSLDTYRRLLGLETKVSIPKRESRSGSYERVSGPGKFRLRAQGGAWVPGSGSGDRVPAMLEPGEFVVNKNAAKQYGGLLNQINFKDAPRFAGGGSLGKLAGISSVGYMLPMILPMNDAMAKLTYTITAAIDAVQIFAGLKGSVGLKNLATKIPTIFERGMANRAIGSSMMKGAGAAVERRGLAAGASRLATGAGKFALGALMSPVGLAVAGTVGLLAIAVMKYRQEVEKSKKAAQEAFSVGKDTAAAYGIEIQSINDKLKENQDLTNSLGMGPKTAPSAATISEDKMKAIKADNANLIGKLNNSGFEKFAGNVVSPQQQQSMLTAKFATLRQQGFSQADALEVVTGIAKSAGTDAQNALYAIKPQLLKITGETQTAVFKSAQDAQIESLKNMKISGDTGSSQAFQEAFKGAIQSIQYAPPQDQLNAMNNFIKNIDTFDASQIKEAGKALADVAKADYGSADSFTKTLTNLSNQGTKDSLKRATLLDTAKRLGMDTTQVEVDFQVSPEEEAQMRKWLEDRKVNIDLEMRNQAQAQAAIDDLNKQMTAQNAKFDDQMAANDKAVEAENNRYKEAAKASAKFVREKQKEVDAINKGADAYIKSLQKEDQLTKFRNEQTNTAFGGLSALAQGDVIGFIKAKQDAEENARQFSADQELASIEEKRKASVDALQSEIDKENEKQANAEEHHQKILDNLEAQRQKYIETNAAAVNGIQSQIDMYTSLQSKSGDAYDKIVGNFKYAATEAEKAGAVAATMNYMMNNPTATIDEAMKAGQDYLGKNVDLAQAAETARENRRASGGYISGAGGPTDDKIPAMLSNGEYVIRASAVDQYGVGMLDQINTQKFASGGVVSFRGKKFDQSTVNKILITEKDLNDMFSFYQGSYNRGGVKASAGTHDGGGVFDVRTPLTSSAVSALRRHGFAAWMRSKAIGGVQHIHALEIGNPNLSPAAAGQVRDYLNGGDGLRGGSSRSNVANMPSETDDNVQSSSESLDQIAKAFGTTAATYNNIKENGLASVLNGRKFGGSMTMNKPYIVGENGPEVVMPYGSGGKVMPRFSVARPASISGVGQSTGDIISSATTNSTVINLSVNGVNDPNLAAQRVIELINNHADRRKFGRGN